MDRLTWESKLWYPPGQAIGVSYQEADISHKFSDLRMDGYQVKLCKWAKTYSIGVYQGDRLLTGIKQIPVADFNARPEKYLKAASNHFDRILPHRTSNISAIERMLLDVYEKHHGGDEDLL